MLFASCSSDKRTVIKTVKYDWDINCSDSKIGGYLLDKNLFIESDTIIPSILKFEDQELEEKQLLASSIELTPSFSVNTMKNTLKIINKSLDSIIVINKEDTLKTINKSFDSIVLINQENNLDNKIKTPSKEGRGGYIFKLIGVSLLLLITGLDVFLALFSIAFDGFYGVSLLFFFSSLILTHLSIKVVKNLKREPKSEKNQPDNNRFKTVLKPLGLIASAVILMAILFSEFII